MLLIERHGDDVVARVRLVESLMQAYQKGETMRPEDVMRRPLGYLKLDIERTKQVDRSIAKFRAEQAERRKRRRLPGPQERCQP
ncbi:MAG TPA: hypothetical protein VG204_09220 [Terriglobia bacterium]|nr:hypothetical protein [Terriglobia bacterium]